MDQLSSLLLTAKRRSWVPIVTFGSVLTAALAYAMFTAPTYRASVRLIVDEQKTSVSELGRTLSEVPNATAGGANPIANQIELVKSRRILQQSLDFLRTEEQFGTDPKDYPNTDDLSQSLKVKSIPATNLLELSYEHNDPEIASQVINSVAEIMVSENTEAIRREASSVREFLERTVPQQEYSLQEAEQREQQFRQANGLIAADIQADTLVQTLASVENSLRDTLTRAQETNTQVAALQDITGINSVDIGYAAIRVGQDAGLQNLRAEMTELEKNIIDSQSRLGDQHPDLLALYDQRDDLERYYNVRFSRIVGIPGLSSDDSVATDNVSSALVSQYIEGQIERNALDSRASVLQASYQDLQNRLTVMPAQQQQLLVLVRQREKEEDSLKLLQKNLEEARIAEAQLISNVRVVDPAVAPDSPIGPNLPAILAMAIAAGLVLSVGSILFLELLDDTIQSSEDIEQLLGVPIVGSLTQQRVMRGEDQLRNFLDSSESIEPYRKLLKAIELRQDSSSNVIAITSTVTGEGKSNVLARLAAVAAISSRRTLVIDASLIQPCQHQLLGAPIQPGLAEVTETSSSLEEAVYQTSVLNLSLLPAGRRLLRPSMALESETVSHLIEEVSKQFDLVFIDVAPIDETADVLTLSKHVDRLFLVIHPGLSMRSKVQSSLSTLEISKKAIEGLIINHTTDMEFQFSGPLAEYQLNTPQALATEYFSESSSTDKSNRRTRAR